MEAREPGIELIAFEGDYREQVLDLWEHAFGRQRDLLESDLDKACAIGGDMLTLAVEDGLVVGTALAATDGYRGWIYYLAVCPTHRRRGVGRLLMGRGEEKLRQLGCEWVNLQVRQRNRSTAGFYYRQGFRIQNTITLTKPLVNSGGPRKGIR